MASDTRHSALEDFLAFDDPETPEKIKEVARKELGETEELKSKCLQKLKTLIKENNLATITRDDFLLRFLRTKKFRVQDSFETLQNYSGARASLHERLLKVRPEILERGFRESMIGIFPYRDAEDRITIYFDADSWNPSVCPDEEAVTVIAVLLNYMGEHESSQTTGVNLFFECKVIPLMLIPYLVRHLPFLIKFVLKFMPARYRRLHFINEHPLLKYILTFIDPLLPKKIKERIVLHGKTRDELFQYYPPRILPECFGGTVTPLTSEHMVQVMLDYFQKMKDEQKYFLPQNS